MNPALLLVDLQNDFLASPGLSPRPELLVTRAAALLDGIRALRIPVIHVWTTLDPAKDRRLPHWRKADRWLCVSGSPGHATPLAPLAGERVIHKTGFNAFHDGTLEVALAGLKIDEVVLAGLHLHACVRSAATECLERGIYVSVAEDAVGSNDPLHAASVRRWLAERCVSFETTRQLLARLGESDLSSAHLSPGLSTHVLNEVPLADKSQVAAAAAGARTAWNRWSLTERSERERMLENIARSLEANAAELSRQMALEIGKPVTHGREEIARAAASIRDVLRCARDVANGTEAGGIVRRRPLGVIAMISPWNNPVAIPLGKIAPALIYGNTMVWKPAPAATRISERLLRLLRQAGAPEHALQLVTGNHATAQQLAADEQVDAVTFTGSVEGGYALQEICARRIVPFQAELSGNNAAILWSDADLASAATQIVRGAFGFAGQRCTATRRVIIHESDFDRILALLKAAGEQMVWGNPLDDRTEIGPLIHRSKRDEVRAWIAAAQDRGGLSRIDWLHQSEAAEPWARDGAYLQPVILCCDDARCSLVQEEMMAPVLVVQRARDFDEALVLCNGVRHGLAAALFSNSEELQRRFLAETRAGILKLNSATAGVDATLPFGGWKASGVGPPEHGEGDALFYTRLQSVYGAEQLLQRE